MAKQNSSPTPAAGRRSSRSASRRTATPRPRESEVFETAAQVFLENGFAGATVQEVADRMGMLKGSLYYYIKSKDELLYRIISDLYQQMAPSLELDRADGDAVERLRTFVRQHLELIVANRAKFAVFYADFRFLSGARKRRVLGWRARYEAVFASLVTQAIAAGDIDRSLDVALFARSWLGLLNSLYLWYREEGGSTPAQMADMYAAWMLDGVGTGHTAPASGRGGSTSR